MNIISEQEDSFVTQHYEEVYRQIALMHLCEELCLKTIEEKKADMAQFHQLYRQLRNSLMIHLSVSCTQKEIQQVLTMHSQVFAESQLQYLNTVLKAIGLPQFEFDMSVAALIREAKSKKQSRIDRLCQLIKNFFNCAD